MWRCVCVVRAVLCCVVLRHDVCVYTTLYTGVFRVVSVLVCPCVSCLVLGCRVEGDGWRVVCGV